MGRFEVIDGYVNHMSVAHWSAASLGLEDSDEFDLRGKIVFDRNHQRIGIVSEVFYCAESLEAKYIEIAPFSENDFATYMYPVELTNFHKSGPIFLNSTYESLQMYDEYLAETVLAQESGLITYADACEAGNLNFHNHFENIA